MTRNARSLATTTRWLLGMVVGLPLIAPWPLGAAPLLDSSGRDSEVAAPIGLEGHILRDVLRRLNAGEVETAIARSAQIIERFGENPAALELLGAALALNGQLDLAVVKLERAIELNPSQSSAYVKLGDIYLARRQDEEAEIQFRKAVLLNDGERRAHQRLGLMLEQQGIVDASIAHLEKGLASLPPDYVGIKVNLARLRNQKGEHQAALALLDGKLSPDADGAGAFLVRGTSRLGLGEVEQAIGDFETARRLAPEDPGVHLAEGIALREAGRSEEAARALRSALHHRPGWPLALYQLAMTQRSLDAHEEAIASLDQALAADAGATAPRIERARYALERDGLDAAVAVFERGWPEGAASPAVFGAIAATLQQKGDFDLAEAALLAGAGRFPDDPSTHYQLGRHYGAIQHYDQAVRALEAAAERAPEDDAILKTLAVAYQRRGAMPEAIDAAARLAGLKGDVDHLFLLASLRDDFGQKEEAKRLYHAILNDDAGHVASLNNLASLLTDEGEAGRALPLALRAAELAPGASYVVDTLGMALLAAGRTADAVEELERANALTPDDPLLLYHLGVARQAIGETGQAKALAGRALALSKDFDGADQARALVEGAE